MIEHGDLVRDKVSGYTGIVVSKVSLIFQKEIEFGVQASNDVPNEYPNLIYYILEGRLEIVEKQKIKAAKKGKANVSVISNKHG